MVTDLCYSEDELQNVDLAEEDVRKKNQELKIKRRDYTGYDDDEFESGRVGIRRGVLSKYDTVIDGEKTNVGLFQLPAGLAADRLLGFPVRRFDEGTESEYR